jgi:hypothetical protein
MRDPRYPRFGLSGAVPPLGKGRGAPGCPMSLGLGHGTKTTPNLPAINTVKAQVRLMLNPTSQRQGCGVPALFQGFRSRFTAIGS